MYVCIYVQYGVAYVILLKIRRSMNYIETLADDSDVESVSNTRYSDQ